MQEHAGSRFAAGLFDQQSEEHRVADWGGDELFTRMPRPRVVDDAPAPRFRPQLVLVDQPVQELTLAEPEPRTAEEAVRERAERLGIALVPPAPERAAPRRAPEPARAAVEPAQEQAWEPVQRARRWEGDDWDLSGARPTKVITGHPETLPQPLATVRAQRRRQPRTPAQIVGPRPERIMAWAFVLGLLLILIAISTADAAPL